MSALELRPLTAQDAKDAARLHATCFDAGWPALDFAHSAALASDILIGGFVDNVLAGLVLSRGNADQAEILTLCVGPDYRGAAFGLALLSACETALAARTVSALFLEVAEDNAPAISLYRRSGFVAQTRRKGYYRRGSGADAKRVDAIVFRKTLSLPHGAHGLRTKA